MLSEFRPFAYGLSDYLRVANLTKKIGPEIEDTWEYKLAYKKGDHFVRESWKWVFRQVNIFQKKIYKLHNNLSLKPNIPYIV